ncbi:MAG: DUF167 domain-containing protein [Rickettsiales bacterium]|nr:DUF167 domain-containing protein [Rickettsiales bacterium]
MILSVRVVPNARKEGLEVLADGRLKAKVRAPALDGRANDALAALLAETYGVPKSEISIVSGHASRNKVVRIGA